MGRIKLPKWTWSVVLVALVARGAQGAAPATAPTVQAGGDTTAVKRGSIDLISELPAVFEALNPFEARLRFKQYQGDLVLIRAAAANAQVTVGDVLLELDSDPINRQIVLAENELSVARANLAKAEADVSLGAKADQLAAEQAARAVKYAEQAIQWWDDLDEKQLAAAMELRRKMEAFNIESQSDELEQLKKMYAAEDITNETADIVVKRAVRILDFYKASAKLTDGSFDRLIKLEVLQRREQLEANLATARQGVSQFEAAQKQAAITREATVVANRAAMQEAQDKLDDLRSDKEVFTIKAPTSGVVIYGSFANKNWQPVEPRTLQPGEKLAPLQVLMTVYTPTKLRAIVQAPESRLTWFSPGDRVHLLPTALPGVMYEGTCGRAQPTGVIKEAEQSFDVPVDLREVDPRLAPGSRATARINAGSVKDVLIVPTTAIAKGGRVWVRTADGTDEMRLITTGRTNGELTEVREGLAEGEQVLTRAKQ